MPTIDNHTHPKSSTQTRSHRKLTITTLTVCSARPKKLEKETQLLQRKYLERVRTCRVRIAIS